MDQAVFIVIGILNKDCSFNIEAHIIKIKGMPRVYLVS